MKKKLNKFEKKAIKIAEDKMRQVLMEDLLKRFNAVHMLYPYKTTWSGGTKYAKLNVADILKLVKFNQDF